MSLDFYLEEIRPCDVASHNITHNVSPMWDLVGLRAALYKSGGRRAGDVLPELIAGLAEMRSKIAECRKLNPENGWGDADRAVSWLQDVIQSCAEHPDATVRISA